MRFITEPAVSGGGGGVKTWVKTKNVIQVTYEESERINKVSVSSQKHLF